jgi:hypothetical protein
MKGIFKVLSVVILLGALVGAAILVSKNQETRRGAASAETSSSILPSNVSTSPGQAVSVHVWLNTGKDTDKLQGAEFRVAYDSTKLSYVGVETQSGFTLVNEAASVDKGSYLDLKMVTLGTEPAGAVDIAKLNFKAVGGASDLRVQQAKVMISGQTSTWDVSKNTSASVVAGGSVTSAATRTPTIIPTRVATTTRVPTTTPIRVTTTTRVPTRIITGMITVVPTRVITRTPSVSVTAGSCGQRCGGTISQGCAQGLTCEPIWWPCGTVSSTLSSKIQSNLGLTQNEVEQMISSCPRAASVLPTGYATMSNVKLPAFYGVCRNPSCISSTNCSCTTSTPVPVTPTYTRITPTGVRTTATPTPRVPTTILGGLKADLNIWEKLDNKVDYKVGDYATVALQFNVPPQGGSATAPGRVSAINAYVKYDNTLLEAVKVDDFNTAFNNILKADIYNSKGQIWFYATSSKPMSELSAGLHLAKITFKVIKSGKAMVGIDRSMPIEMSGVDNSSRSIAYTVTVGEDKYLTIGTAGQCQLCSGTVNKVRGDANCDGLFNSIDFEIWRSEMFDQGGLSGTVKSTWKSDFSCDQKVSGVDFEIWRSTVFQ